MKLGDVRLILSLEDVDFSVIATVSYLSELRVILVGADILLVRCAD
jgi:hypothetical protein